MKLIEKSFICSFVFILSFSVAIFSAQCSDIENSILRMHVIANSDSDEDQRVKLLVKDEVVKEGAKLLENAETKEEAINILMENILLLEETANKELFENGFDEKACVSIEKTFFPTRQYENVTLPAGMYDSLLVEIGEAKGKNFWCVMFPSMCIPMAQDEDKLCEVLTLDEYEITSNPQKFKIQWKTAEIFEKIRNLIKNYRE